MRPERPDLHPQTPTRTHTQCERANSRAVKRCSETCSKAEQTSHTEEAVRETFMKRASTGNVPTTAKSSRVSSPSTLL
eukprot:m.86862 g.86862  ORF g.86862 m.86862 type:complete len:78 (+) comp11498_c1_seq1:168-401(+)